ncbi:E3 ubiquitin ligase [Ciborinia camelliae]|nr:E3 ubiquitin ligase [Ciborinia camelliae]
MNSSSSALISTATSSRGSRIHERISRSRETTPAAIKVETVIKVEDDEPAQSDAQLATKYKEDLIGMRRSLTCSICDQLLYEPWTLQCGHTYCYSCLCQWFIPNKRKKTCPECRTAVKQIPAPAFIVKHMVEIFINRGQLMPHDETVEQHKVKNAEETQMVENDKNSPEGLFRGSFPLRHGELWRDEADGVMRCPSCGHEHEGGPTCETCGAEFDDIYDFSDMSDDGELSDIEVGYDDEDDDNGGLEAELQIGVDAIANMVHGRGINYQDGIIGGPRQFLHHYHTHHHHHSFSIDDTTDDSEDISNQDNSEDEDEDAGSLEDFIAPDEGDDDDNGESNTPPRQLNQRVVTIISDDDDSEDEGGAITNRLRRPRTGWTRTSDIPSMSISISEDENGSSANGSEFGDDDDSHEVRMRLRASGGWSPLDEGEDDDAEAFAHNNHGGYPTSEDERATDESDSETIGNPNSDSENEDDHDRSREGFSETPGYGTTDPRRTSDDYPPNIDQYGDATPINYATDRDDASNNYGSENENHYDYDTDGDQSIQTNIDRDGDTEMDTSPGLSRSSRSVSVDSHYGENLGVANEMAEVDDDSSDTSIRPPPRRQPRQNPYIQQYDPRISMLLAEHQISVRNAQNPPGLDGLDEIRNTIRVEPTSRSRRRAQYHYQTPSLGNNDARNNHRIVAPRGFDRARTPRGSPPPRVVSASSRNNRSQRQYQR